MYMIPQPRSSFFFFFNDTATTEIYTLSLHDALPISVRCVSRGRGSWSSGPSTTVSSSATPSVPDRKSTRLNSSHDQISYAVFCLKKKNWTFPPHPHTPALTTRTAPYTCSSRGPHHSR